MKSEEEIKKRITFYKGKIKRLRAKVKNSKLVNWEADVLRLEIDFLEIAIEEDEWILE